MTISDYDRFADIYTVWTETAAATPANREFYLNHYARADGPVVELGVGDGRIVVPAASAGQHMTGVDLSPRMLDLCRDRARHAGVLDRLTLIEADFRTFVLTDPAALIALPYHSIGHLRTLDDKRDVCRHVWSQLRPGGRFIFDDFFMTSTLMARMRQVQLRAQYRSASGADTLLWVTSLIDEVAQSIGVVTWEDTLDAAGVQMHRQYRRLNLSWLTPTQAREMLIDTGFVIDACHGDFAGTPFTTQSASEQVWIVHRPE